MKNSIQILFIAIISVLVTSCGIRVDSDYDTQTNFETYKTFCTDTEHETGFSELDNKRIFSILEQQLINKGFTKSDSPDIYVHVVSDNYITNSQNTVGVGLGGTGRTIGGGVSIGIPVGNDIEYRQITLDFIDAKTNHLIWQAITNTKYNPNASPEKREAILNEVVLKSLEKYPPKK